LNFVLLFKKLTLILLEVNTVSIGINQSLKYIFSLINFIVKNLKELKKLFENKCHIHREGGVKKVSTLYLNGPKRINDKKHFSSLVFDIFLLFILKHGLQIYLLMHQHVFSQLDVSFTNILRAAFL